MKNSIWVSQSSAESGQPWLNTMGCPEPQSLKKISVPSFVVIVGMTSILLAVSFQAAVPLIGYLSPMTRIGDTDILGGETEQARLARPAAWPRGRKPGNCVCCAVW